ncbi:uncharacterized protein DUF3649 [Pseudacidovorax intermedius]|uniref:Uncharacterized protein DUF3649 n=1 Tax=Pseudacidovorax intermedius TaxID=433924 RepID=A0A370FG59_9BURK|nr:DUF3649 domain-containing protein [Pseudacidovorax intermedius]RDI25045.1 uncharacterized protein DUF3649 [Pseudacidovorax intermedius]
MSGALPLAQQWLARTWQAGPVVSRIAAAVGGGYALGALTSVAALALPASRPQTVLGGALASFAVFAAAVIWVFAARSATRAWVGLLIAAMPLLLASVSVWRSGAAG